MNLQDFFRNTFKPKDIVFVMILSIMIFSLNGTELYNDRRNERFTDITNSIIETEDRIFHLDFRDYVRNGNKNMQIQHYKPKFNFHF
jgi:hypothetical protein